MACFERSIGTVIELVEEFFVVDPNPFKPDEVEVDFFLVAFFASRTVEVVVEVVGAQKELRRILDGLNADTDDADARKINAETAIFIFDGSTFYKQYSLLLVLQYYYSNCIRLPGGK
jgi:hypothetical protein